MIYYPYMTHLHFYRCVERSNYYLVNHDSLPAGIDWFHRYNRSGKYSTPPYPDMDFGYPHENVLKPVSIESDDKFRNFLFETFLTEKDDMEQFQFMGWYVINDFNPEKWKQAFQEHQSKLAEQRKAEYKKSQEGKQFSLFSTAKDF